MHVWRTLLCTHVHTNIYTTHKPTINKYYNKILKCQVSRNRRVGKGMASKGYPLNSRSN